MTEKILPIFRGQKSQYFLTFFTFFTLFDKINLLQGLAMSNNLMTIFLQDRMFFF